MVEAAARSEAGRAAVVATWAPAVVALPEVVAARSAVAVALPVAEAEAAQPVAEAAVW